MSERVDAPVRPRAAVVAATFCAVVLLTALELIVVGLEMDRAARITTLAGLLMAKVGLVLVVFMRAREGRPAVRLALTAIVLAAGAAIVLMLETIFRVGVR